jgi:hypothetical protein
MELFQCRSILHHSRSRNQIRSQSGQNNNAGSRQHPGTTGNYTPPPAVERRGGLRCLPASDQVRDVLLAVSFAARVFARGRHRVRLRKALRKGRLFREVKLRRLRRNHDCGIGSRRKPTLVEALKAHRGMTGEPAESCGENRARCGRLAAIGDVLRLRSARFGAKTRVDGSA